MINETGALHNFACSFIRTAYYPMAGIISISELKDILFSKKKREFCLLSLPGLLMGCAHFLIYENHFYFLFTRVKTKN